MTLLLLCARCSRHSPARAASVICSDCRGHLRRKKPRARTAVDTSFLTRDAAMRGVALERVG